MRREVGTLLLERIGRRKQLKKDQLYHLDLLKKKKCAVFAVTHCASLKTCPIVAMVAVARSIPNV